MLPAKTPWQVSGLPSRNNYRYDVRHITRVASVLSVLMKVAGFRPPSSQGINMLRLLTSSILLGFMSTLAWADSVQVAVASNFAAAMEEIATVFEKDTGHKALISSGATGKFYTQIKSGAPFEVFLSADEQTPARIESEGLAVADSRFTYAVGKLTLWSARPNYVDREGLVLRKQDFAHLSLANPKTAPYGAAAIEVMTHLGVLKSLEPRFVMGENIAQTHQFIATGNSELGFVALSQIYKKGQLTSGSAWLIPENLHNPIKQDAVLLKKAAGNPAAKALMSYLKSEKARRIILLMGYSL